MLHADRELARRLEAAEAKLAADYARVHAKLFPDGKAAEAPIADGYAVFCGPHHPMTKAIGLGTSQACAADDVDQVEAFYSARHAPSAFDLAPTADPSLVALLAARHYHVEYFRSVLVRSLTSPDPLPTSHGGVRVRALQAGEKNVWARTAIEGFDSPLNQETLGIYLPHAHQSYNTCFLAFVEDHPVPVGAAALSLYQGMATLFCTSTLPAFRRRGIHAALMVTRLHHAKRNGAELAAVTTRPGTDSQRNLERLGFQVVYTKPLVRQSPASH